MGLDASGISVTITATQSNPLDLITGTAAMAYTKAIAFSNGTGPGQADRLFSDTRTLAPSAAEDLDLAGVLTDVFGAVLTYARVKVFMIKADPANTNNVVVGNAATNGFISWVGAATHTVTLRPGAFLLVGGPDATGYTVTAATADLLHVANSGAGTSVNYDVVILGASV